ncbi:Putative uncharacterized protein ART2, partial [Linum perenne]
VRIRTRNQNQTSFYPSVPHEISVFIELIYGHLRYLLTDVPPQPNSPLDNVFHPDRPAEQPLIQKEGLALQSKRLLSRSSHTLSCTRNNCAAQNNAACARLGFTHLSN